ncbi:DHHC zinc finger domain containing protein [Babesia ovis]|uniref:Palmitoyltransferase n=1 Tax=Babesia ovis TaxID=5869 RepID=A0A9W5WU92_BABOV|nr:DHHC zinc finger domain containing protein [Babesia ovis]
MDTAVEDDVTAYHAIPSEPGWVDDEIEEKYSLGPNPKAFSLAVAVITAEWIQMLWIAKLMDKPKYYLLFSTMFLVVLTTMVLLNMSNPGVIDKDIDLELYRAEGAPATAIELHNGRFIQRWCVTCRIYKPPRVKHCYECRRCVERFDHHCQWLSNCIGKHNYKMFVNFWLCYGLIESYLLYFILRCIKKVSLVGRVGKGGGGLKVFASNHTILLIVTVIACLRTLLVIYNALCNVYLISKNMTYYEYLTRPYQGRNPFDEGLYNNIKEFWSLPNLDIRYA